MLALSSTSFMTFKDYFLGILFNFVVKLIVSCRRKTVPSQAHFSYWKEEIVRMAQVG